MSDPSEGVTTYAMIDNSNESNHKLLSKVLVIEVWPPQKLGEGDGRISMEQAQNWVLPHEKDAKTGIGSFHPYVLNVGYRSGGVEVIAERMLKGEE